MHQQPANAEPPPETAKIGLSQIAGICIAPQYVAEELLKIEGFTEFSMSMSRPMRFTRRSRPAEFDISMAFVAPFIVQADAGLPVVLLGGVHSGMLRAVRNPTRQVDPRSQRQNGGSAGARVVAS